MVALWCEQKAMGEIMIVKKWKSKIFISIFILSALSLICGCGRHTSYPDYDNNQAIVNGSCNVKNCSSNVDDTGKTLTFQIGNLNGPIQLAEAKIASDSETVVHISATANCGKVKFVLIRPYSDVVVIKEINSKKNKSFDGDITISCQKGKNAIKVVGSDYAGKFAISQNQNILFKYSGGLFDDAFPFGKNSNLNKKFPFK